MKCACGGEVEQWPEGPVSGCLGCGCVYRDGLPPATEKIIGIMTDEELQARNAVAATQVSTLLSEMRRIRAEQRRRWSTS